MGNRTRAAVATVVVGIMAVMAVMPAATAAELPDQAPLPAPADIEAPASPTRLSGGPPAVVRQLARVLPTLRRMPIGTTIRRLRPGNGEACPGVRARGPRPVASVARSFDIPGNEGLTVQAVAYKRPRQAQRALDTWFRQSTRDCRRYRDGDWRYSTSRTRPPFVRAGDSRAAVRSRAVVVDPVYGRLHAAESVTVVYRDGRYLLVATSSKLIEFIGQTPQPNFARWADTVAHMYSRAGRLPR